MTEANGSERLGAVVILHEAVALKVSDRTIRTYLDFMRDRLNAPSEKDRQRGYYYTDLDWQLQSTSLSQGELFALTLGARMLEAYSQSAYSGLHLNRGQFCRTHVA